MTIQFSVNSKLTELTVRLWRVPFLALNLLPIPPRKYCCICERGVLRFVPYRGGSMFLPPLSRALGVVGSDVDHFECPHCGASDRDRHLVLYMNAAGITPRIAGSRILHFAPEKHISTLIAAQKPSHYVQADKFPVRAGVVELDITGIAAADRSFDIVIANHVLEHVDDVLSALKEITRVLSHEGFAILQTPFASSLARTFEDSGIEGAFARLHAYGQEDHVRLFGRDIAAIFTSQGLDDCISTHQALLPEIDPKRYGVNPAEPFMIFQKSAE
ncbi:methyltransferase domain-containing protein [Variovorax sp. KK3]|uniref:class I SAM-dependent methyltransferase n=1 Tax=Variovorax sp. KK3 TaxID=1855728 RepID=UPI0009FB06EF|nr:methyltransferase domain-containing protein [Variovorax sp. KK3]